MNVDDIFMEIGQFGPYQIRQYILLAFPILFSAYQTITFVFTTAAPDFRCFVPECEVRSSTEFWTPWLNSTMPFKGGFPEPCVRFKPSMNHTIYHTELNTCNTIALFDEEEIISCDSFVFSESEITVASEFEIVCPNNDWKIVIVVTVTYMGFFIGMPVAGLISDRIGRKKVMIYSWFLQSVIAILRSFATSYEMFLLLQALGAFSCGAYNAGFIMALEALGPSMRVLGNALICCFHSLGQVNVGMTMWLTRDWRRMTRILFGPGLFAPLYFWLVPESVRWLISKGESEKAIVVFKQVAELNRTHLTPTFENHVRQLSAANSPPVEQAPQEPQIELNQIGDAEAPQIPVPAASAENARNDEPTGLAKILTSKILMMRLFNCVICWASISMLFYALSLKSVTVSGNKYLNFVLAVIVEVPGYLATFILMEVVQIGRRSSLFTSLTMTGISCQMYFVLQAFNCVPLLQVFFFLTAKLCITFSFAVIYIYSAEMFPTEIRNSVLGICSMAGHIGSIFAPASLLLIKRFDPIVIWGTVAIVGGVFSLRFPETRDAVLPETIADAETLT